MTIERIDIIITEKGGKVVKRSLDDISESAQKVDTNLGAMNKTGLAVGAALGAALGGLAVMLFNGFKNAAASINETYKAAKQLGTTVESFSRLDFAAKSADLTTKDLESSMAALQKTQVQVAKGSTDQAVLFRQLGINALEADGQLRSTEAVLRDVADIFQAMPDGANKSALAFKLFGDQGRQLIPLLNQGSDGLDQMAKKSDELGYTLSGETAQSVKDFYDQLDDVKLQIEAMYRQALPGLLPLLKEFSQLLDSQEFKDGFNTIIQGAAQAVIWLTKFATTTANVTKFIGEEIAARTQGTNATDTVRVEQRIERLQSTIKALQDAEKTAGFSVFNASELEPGDLLKTRKQVISRLHVEMQKEQAKLEIGVSINEEAAMKAAEEARKIAEEGLKPPVDPPTIDWTQLAKGKGGDGGADKAARELERLQNQLDSLVSTIDPVTGAQLRLADAQDIFNKAIGKGLITQEHANELMVQYKELMQDQLDPIGAVNRELDKQLKIAGLLGDEREIEIQMMNIVENLKRENVKLTEDQTEAMREQLKVLQELDKLSAAKESMLRDSQARNKEDFDRNLQAMQQLMADPSQQFGQADAFGQANDMMGGAFDNSQQAFDLQVEQRAEYYRRIDELRQLDVINDQTAQQAKKEFENNLLQQRLDKYSTYFGALAGLASSENKELARIGKAAAVVDATIKGVQAVQNAYAQVPYPANIGAAAAMAVVAAANVASIVSQPLPAFRTGGSMTVGGSGGTDSQTVAFRATPGEKININTPSQARAAEQSGGNEITIPLTVVNVKDEKEALALMGSGAGKEVFMNMMAEDPAGFRQVLNLNG